MMTNHIKILNTKITCSFTLYYLIENEAPQEGCDNFRHVVPNRDFRPFPDLATQHRYVVYSTLTTKTP